MLQRRVKPAHQRFALGAQLADALEPDGAPRRLTIKTPTMACMVVGTVLLPLAAIVEWPIVAVVGGTSLWGVAIWRMRRESRQPVPGGTPAPVSVDDLHALDARLEAAADQWPEPVVAAVWQTKHELARVLRASQTLGLSDGLRPDDRHYLHECVRRYLPDALSTYERIPQDLRDTAVMGPGSAATEVLLSQLAVIRRTLEEQLSRCVAEAGETLARQHQFLQEKADQGHWSSRVSQ